MSQTGEQLPTSRMPTSPKMTRRQFLQCATLASIGTLMGVSEVSATVVPVDPSEQPKSPFVPASDAFVSSLAKEQVNPSEVRLYNDLTPGIGIGVAWNGSRSVWNPIVENIIKAAAGVGIAPHIFVPSHLSQDFDEFALKEKLERDKIIKITCDPQYSIDDDANEIDAPQTKSSSSRVQPGFISSWIRDWGPLIGSNGSKIVQYNIRKGNMPDPLKGVTGINTMEVVNPGIQFDGGAFFQFTTKNGVSYCLVAQNELVNNNIWQFPSDVDPKAEAEKRLKLIVGQKTKIVMLPSLTGNTVDHIDTYTMPLGNNTVVLGEVLSDDPDNKTLNDVGKLYSSLGFDTPRIPIRREDNNIISWANVQANATKNGEKFLLMPVYSGFEQENNQAEAVYKNLGFNVVRVNADSVRSRSGSVHCACNTSVTAPFVFN